MPAVVTYRQCAEDEQEFLDYMIKSNESVVVGRQNYSTKSHQGGQSDFGVGRNLVEFRAPRKLESNAHLRVT